MALHIVFSSDTTHARQTSLKKYQKHAQGFAETEVTEVSSRLAHYFFFIILEDEKKHRFKL
jgi:hypothetical protein